MKPIAIHFAKRTAARGTLSISLLADVQPKCSWLTGSTLATGIDRLLMAGSGRPAGGVSAMLSQRFASAHRAISMDLTTDRGTVAGNYDLVTRAVITDK